MGCVCGWGGVTPTYYLAYFIAENCIKMKDIGPGEPGVSLAPPLGSADDLFVLDQLA